ncbi:MAG TPA: GyrI-like domain-containing protein [Bryobacteraceae bacterium]|nr:GyrI-like domain-containing protein [Bryobacteraceae bacterium]
MKADPLLKASAKDPELVSVPGLRFFMIDGSGDPNGPEFQDAVGALYGAAYTVKFALRKTNPQRDYRVKPLEGLWWCEGIEGFDLERRDTWRWTLMIRQPDFVTRGMLKSAIEQVAERRGRTPALARVRLATYKEGRAVQMLHVGPYSAEARTLERMRAFVTASGLEYAGKHHEIYLSDPRRTAPEKIRTILRQPVKKARKARSAAA